MEKAFTKIQATKALGAKFMIRGSRFLHLQRMKHPYQVYSTTQPIVLSPLLHLFMTPLLHLFTNLLNLLMRPLLRLFMSPLLRLFIRAHKNCQRQKNQTQRKSVTKIHLRFRTKATRSQPLNQAQQSLCKGMNGILCCR